MTSGLPLRIVTPEKVAWEGTVASLTVPAWEGSLGILPGHAPLLAQLKEGVVMIREEGGAERPLAVSGGFVEVDGGKAALFAETAELGDEIDAERARQAAEKAKQTAKTAPSDVMDEAAAAALRRALARLRVAEMARFRRDAGKAPRPHE